MPNITWIVAMLAVFAIGAIFHKYITWPRVIATAVITPLAGAALLLIALIIAGKSPAVALILANFALATGWYPPGPDAWLVATLPIWMATSFLSVFVFLAAGWQIQSRLKGK